MVRITGRGEYSFGRHPVEKIVWLLPRAATLLYRFDVGNIVSKKRTLLL